MRPAASLLRFAANFDKDKHKEPAALGVIININTSTSASASASGQRPDGVHIIPIGAFGT